MKWILDELYNLPVDEYIYPTNKEASEAFNVLIWWCIGMWMEEWDYSDKELCEQLSKYISLLK